jgi:hypothetical protein
MIAIEEQKTILMSKVFSQIFDIQDHNHKAPWDHLSPAKLLGTLLILPPFK